MTRTTRLALLVIVLAVSSALQAQTGVGNSSTSPSGRYVAIGCLSKQGAGAAAR